MSESFVIFVTGDADGGSNLRQDAIGHRISVAVTATLLGSALNYLITIMIYNRRPHEKIHANKLAVIEIEVVEEEVHT